MRICLNYEIWLCLSEIRLQNDNIFCREYLSESEPTHANKIKNYPCNRREDYYFDCLGPTTFQNHQGRNM